MRRSLAWVAIAGCSLPAGDYFGRIPDPIDPTHFRWCNQGEPDHLDPTLSSSTVTTALLATLFDGLTTYGLDGLPVPSLATHWEISDDLRTFTFHLRRDARWSNGRAVTAHDIAHSALRVVHPLTASPNADTLAPIKGATRYLTRQVFVLRRAVAPLEAGDVVELVDGGAKQGASGGADMGASGGAKQGASDGAKQGASGGAKQGASGGEKQGASDEAKQGASGGVARDAATKDTAVTDAAVTDAATRDAVARDAAARAAAQPLALRDLGAPESAAFAIVPPGTAVTLMMETGGRATLPSPDGRAWAYVFWQRDLEGVSGWVPARDLDEPTDDRVVSVRRAASKDTPRRRRDEDSERPVVSVAARDLVYSTDAIGIAVPDPYTIVFETADPTPYFVELTSKPALRATPIEAWSRRPRHWDRPEHIVTSGPFHLVAWEERDRVELVRSATYWDRGAVKLERFTALSIDDQAAATNLYFTGACDATAANTIPSSYLPAINGELRGGRAYKDYDASPFLGVYFAWIQTRKLSNRHLRRALALAIDRAAIPRFTHGGEIPSAQLTPGTPIAALGDADLAACGVTREARGVALVMASGQLCYVPPPGLDHDLAAARREIALARSEGGVPEEPIEYRYNAGSEAHKQIAEYLQAAWERIGVPVRITAQEWNSLLDDTRKGDYEIARLGNIGTATDPESEFLVLFRCDSPDNRGKYCSAEFEQRMDEARAMSDRRARNARLREAEAVMIEDAPVLPLYVYTQKHLVKPYVRDYARNLIDLPPLWRIWIDPGWRR